MNIPALFLTAGLYCLFGLFWVTPLYRQPPAQLIASRVLVAAAGVLISLAAGVGIK